MKRLNLIFVALLSAALMLSASATAGQGKAKNEAKKQAAAQCKAEKQADKEAFKATYGKRAMRTCKKGEKQEAKAALKQAKNDCKAERDADRAAFEEKYGTNKNKKNAFGKCVSASVEEENASDEEAFANAAKQCRAERDSDPEAFEETWGSNKNKKNAFGKCVSATAQEADEADDGVDEEGDDVDEEDGGSDDIE